MQGAHAMKMASVAAVLALCAVAGCGSGLREAAVFRGDTRPARGSANRITETLDLRPEHVRLGEVSADCTLTEGRKTIEHEWLSDVDCSEARLLRVLMEEAAERGGDGLYERECYSRVLSRHDGRVRRFSRCVAQVSRSRSGAVLTSSAVYAPPEPPPAADAWRICVQFWPTGERPRSARRSDLVQDVAIFPVSHVRLGDITASCEQGCSRDAVRDGVRIAAGHLGANDVVDVSCIQRGSGYSCSGTAAVYASNPLTTPAAR